MDALHKETLYPCFVIFITANLLDLTAGLQIFPNINWHHDDRAIEIRRTTASNCVEMRGTVASNCMEMRGTAACKCEEMRRTAACVGMQVAWTPPNRGSSARDASGKRAGGAAQVRLKRVEPRFQALVGPVFIRDRHVKG